MILENNIHNIQSHRVATAEEQKSCKLLIAAAGGHDVLRAPSVKSICPHSF